MKCRHCSAELKHTMIDLGYAPPSNAYLAKSQLNAPEIYYPLRVRVCNHCWLVQTEDYAQADQMFDENYAYFSSTSVSWLAHAKDYCDEMTKRLVLNDRSLVVELASNDGYLLKNFLASGVPCLGIEPTKSTATAAVSLGIPVVQEFFSLSLAQRLASKNQKADLILGNNVYAHVPDINDFTAGIKALLKQSGTVTLEFPHLMNLMQLRQIDTIYHEHFSYLSLTAVKGIFERSGLRVWHVETLTTHGGSLRVFGCHQDDTRPDTPEAEQVLAKERDFGLDSVETYLSFQSKVIGIKLDVMNFLVEQKRLGKKVAAYGAAAKGNTLLNYCGIHADLIDYVCDAATAKQNHLMPGSHIPIVHPDHLISDKPDYIFILPWNLRTEIMQQLKYARDWGAHFVTAIPSLAVF
jgi:hypothetical protein